MGNEFYNKVVRKHLQKLIEEQNYYLDQVDSHSGVDEQGYALMADFYGALIVAAEKHIEENSR